MSSQLLTLDYDVHLFVFGMKLIRLHNCGLQCLYGLLALDLHALPRCLFLGEVCGCKVYPDYSKNWGN